MKLQREKWYSFQKRKVGLSETKLKRNWEVSWCGLNNIIAGVQNIERAGQGMAVLMNFLIDTGYVQVFNG